MMFSRPALILLVVGLTSVSALSETIPKPFSPVLQRDSDALRERQEIVESPLGVDPATCPTIRCAEGSHPVYHAGSRVCSCVVDSSPCGNTIYCGSGSHALLQPNSNVCACQTDAGTESCPLIKCSPGTHIVYHNEIHSCSCVADCPGLNCTAMQHPVWNFASLECSCELVSSVKPREVVPLDPLAEDISSHTIVKTTYTGPYTKRDVSDSTALINPGGPMVALTTGGQIPGGTMITATTTANSILLLPTPFRPHPGKTCPDLICSDAMYAAFNMTTNICECKPMRGISPILTPTILQPGGPMITARGDTTFVTFTRTLKPSACPSHNVMCEVGNQPSFNLKNGKCECAPFPNHTSHHTSSTATGTLAPLPTITGHLGGCQNMFCIAEKTPVWNDILGACDCEWIDGFGPVSA